MCWQLSMGVLHHHHTESKLYVVMCSSPDIINRNDSQNKCIKLIMDSAITFIANILFILTYMKLIPRTLEYTADASPLVY